MQVYNRQDQNLVITGDREFYGTITVQVAVLLPSTVVAVMVAVPELKAVTAPVDGITLATAGLLLDHVTLLIDALAGAKVVVNITVASAANDSVDLSITTFATGT